jgi:hypothetical protein
MEDNGDRTYPGYSGIDISGILWRYDGDILVV